MRVIRRITEIGFLLALGGCAGKVGAGSDCDACTGTGGGDDTASESGDTKIAARDGASGKGGDAGGLPSSTMPAFPGAEGFGADTPGGRGGKIIEVTNLNDKGPGSFREAVLTTGKRIVVFRVSGTITLDTDISILGKTRSFLTIAGQTSPGGIQLKGPKRSLQLGDVHDVVIRHLRIRPGTTDDDSYETTAPLMMSGGTTNVVIDHCSLQWGNHWMVGTYQSVGKLTFQWNLIAEGAESPYGMGFVVSYTDGKGVKISLHHNLMAHMRGPNPGASGAEAFDVRNNFIYDYYEDTLRVGEKGVANVNFVNNRYLPGPVLPMPGQTNWLYAGAKIFTDGNWGPRCPTGCANDWDNGFGDGVTVAAAKESTFRMRTAFSVPPVTTQPAGEIEKAIVASAGATKPVRDSLDTRIVADVVKRTGSYAPKNVGHGPWPTLTGAEPPPDRDHDGMPDSWETGHGLNLDDAADGAAIAGNQYTNVENYLNALAGDVVP